MEIHKGQQVGLASFEGTASEVGKELAQVAGDAIVETLSRPERKRPPAAEEVAAFVKACEQMAPHWLEELEAMAEVLGVKADDLLAANASPPVRPDEGCCTSFALAPDMTTTGAPILHKNRDFAVAAQIAYFKRVKGFKRFLGSASAWDLGTAHFMNESGLAGAPNTGSPVKDTNEGGVTDRHTMRLVAETASSCEDAVAIVEEVVGRGLVCTENGRGFILIFADPKGLVVVEHSGKKVAWRKVDEGFVVRSNHFVLPEMAEVMASEPDENTKARFAAVQAEIAPGGPPWDVSRVFKVARKRGVCRGSTVSAFTHRISRQFPDVLSVAWVSIGPPLLSSFVPVPCCSAGVPEDWANGTAWVSPKPIEESKHSPKIEELESSEKALVEALAEALDEARGNLRLGKRDLALKALSRRLSEWAIKRKTTTISGAIKEEG